MLLDFDTGSMASYRKFLKLKSLPTYSWKGTSAVIPDEYASLMNLAAEPHADLPIELCSQNFDYQADISRLAIRKKKFAVFVEPGYGKTNIMWEFARHALKSLANSGRKVLTVSPLMVIDQSIAEAARFYPELHVRQLPASGLQDWLKSPGSEIGITNYEAIREGLDRGNLGALLLDECFPAGTKVDCVDVNCSSTQCNIENLSCGDTIKNASGVDRVVRVKKKEVKYACAFTAGKRIVASPNHPVFTQRGWVLAQDLEPGDSILSTREAMRIMREDVSSKEVAWSRQVLRSILLSEMANESASVSGECSQCGSGQKERGRKTQMVCCGKSSGGSGEEANCWPESNDDPRSEGEGVEDSEGHEAQTFRAWWQRDGIDFTSDDLEECSWRDLGNGVCVIAGKTQSRISNMLQARLSKSRNESRYRSGWKLASLKEGSGQEKGCDAGFVRVESLEILEQGNPELEGLRDASGKLYFYDIQAERHPSFSVNGLLVHNSSLLKSAYGAWGVRLIEMGRGLEWKLALTGTPAPNDRVEYANHAIFCDHFRTANEFYARYFVNKGQTQNRWELKPHALKPFYRDLSHWCIFMTNPATYGWKDNCDVIPPINVHIERIELTADQQRISQKMTGGLFVDGIGGIGERSKMAQLAKGRHKGEAVSTNKPAYIKKLVESWPEESTIIWCYHNDEQDDMEKLFPEAASIQGKTPVEHRKHLISWFKGEICRCELQRLIKSTCGSTTRKTSTKSKRGLQSKGKDTTQSGEQPTPLIQKCSNSAETTQSNGPRKIQESASHKTCEDTDSQSLTTSECLGIRMEGVPSAERLQKKGPDQPEDSMLTTATTPEKSEDCYATTATYPLESSTTIQTCSSGQQCTCDRSRGRVLISKADCLGFGLNLQIATRHVFNGLKDSYEDFWQCCKRSNRVGSTLPLNVHIPITELEEPMVQTVMLKAARIQQDTEEQEKLFNETRIVA